MSLDTLKQTGRLTAIDFDDVEPYDMRNFEFKPEGLSPRQMSETADAVWFWCVVLVGLAGWGVVLFGGAL